MKLTLVSKIVLLVLLISGVGVAGLAYFSFRDARTLLQDQALQSLGDDISKEAVVLSDILEQTKNNIKFLVEYSTVKNIFYSMNDGDHYTTNKNWESHLEKIFFTTIKQHPSYYKIRLIGVKDNGKEIASIYRKGDNIIITKAGDLQSKSHRPYFKETIKLNEGEFYFSEINLNREYGEIEKPYIAVFRIGSPVFSDKGEVLGIVIISLNFDIVTNSLRKAPDNVSYFLAKGDGEYLYHTDTSKISKFDLGEGGNLKNDFKGIDFFSDKEPVGSINDASSINLPKLSLGVSFKHLHLWSSNLERKFIIGAIASYDVIDIKSRVFRNKLTVLAVVMMIISGATLALVMHYFLLPIKKLTNISNRIARGEKGVEIPLLEKGEVGELAYAFKFMVDSNNAALLELRQSKEVIESLVDGIITISSEGIIIGFSNVAVKIFGYQVSDVFGENISMLMPSRNAEKHDNYIQNFLKTGNKKIIGKTREVVGLRSDGSEFPLEISIGEMETDEKIIFIASVRDITDKKDLEHQLDNILLSAGEGIQGLDLDGNITFSNLAACEMLGYSETEMLHKLQHSLIHHSHNNGEKYDDADCHIYKALKAGETISYDRDVFWCKDGGNFPVQYTSTPTRGRNGEINGAVVVFRDITENKMREQISLQLLETQQAISVILQKLGLPNQSMEEMLDGFMESILSMSWLNIKGQGGIFLVEGDEKILTLTSSKNLSPEINKACNKVPFGTCLCGRAAEHKRLIHAPCVDKWHDITFEGMKPHGHYNIPILNGDKVIGVLVLYLEHGKEEDYYEVNFLENVTELLSIAIQRKQAEYGFIIAKNEAEQAAQSKADFLANMSHEIRTPMNGIIGIASLIEDTELSKKQKSYINTIKNSGQSLLVILNEILDFSSLEAGKIDIISEPFDLCSCIDDIYKLFEIPVQEKGLELEVEYNDLPDYVLGDQGRIRQVIINLLNNAMKFTDTGSVRLEAAPFEGSDGAKYIKFSVHDTGSGIPKEKLQDLFQVFSQVDSSSVRKAGGTGLGLSICKALAEMMGGKIGVDSDDGKGSTFWFTLPLSMPSEGQIVALCTENLLEDTLSECTFYNAKVLLVEDVEVNRFVITEMLEGYGCKVDYAKNGKVALDMVGDKDYDIIFMDCQMPVMDGFEATKGIIETGDDTPIIALTANVLEAEKKKCYAAGMVGFISKPVTKDMFAPVFNKWIPDLVVENNKSKSNEKEKDVADSKNSGDHVDFKVLEQFGSNVGKVIELTLQDADNIMEAIEKAVEQKNSEDLGLEAHSLKSVAAQVGAMTLSKISKEIEAKGKSADLGGVVDLFDALKSEYDIVKQLLLEASDDKV